MHNVSIHIKCFILLIIALLLSANHNINGQGFLLVYGKLKVKYGDISRSKLILYEKDEIIETYSPTNTGKFEVELDYYKEYVMVFTKDGYVEKKISFDTYVPSELENEKLGPIDFIIDLFPMAEGVDLSVFKNPVGHIKYDRSIDNFDYDKDYSRQIEAKVKRAEEAIMAKYKDLDKEEVDDVIQDFKAEARERRKASEEKEKLSEEEFLSRQQQFKEDAEKRKREEEERAEQQRQQMIAKAKAQEEAESKRMEEERKRKEEEEAARLARLQSEKEAFIKAQSEKAIFFSDQSVLNFIFRYGLTAVRCYPHRRI